MGELALVDPTVTEVGLDVVVTDPRGGVECCADVRVGHVGDQRSTGRSGGSARVLRPDPGVAVGLQFQPHRTRGRPGVACLDPARCAEQALHVVAILVGDHVCAGERPAFRAKALLKLLEEV